MKVTARRATWWALMGASVAALAWLGAVVVIGLAVQRVLAREDLDDQWPGEATDFGSMTPRRDGR